MGAYSKILVAYDGSDSSTNALKQTVSRFEDSWIKVLAVVPSYEGDLDLIGIRDLEAVLRGPRESLLKSARELTEPDSDRIKTEVVQGDAFEQIVDTAERESCNLIVMGRRGLHRVERMLMGSVTAQVIVHTPKDVLVVPRGATSDWSEILVASDGSAQAQAAMAKASHYARESGCHLTAVSVVDMYPETYADAPEVVARMEQKAAKILQEAKSAAEEDGLELETQMLHGDPAGEIVDFAKKNGTGVIFVGSTGRSGLKKIFMGNVTQKVIGLAGCDVFVAKAGD